MFYLNADHEITSNISVNHIRVEIYKTFRGKLNNGICNKKGKKYAIKHLQKMC